MNRKLRALALSSILLGPLCACVGALEQGAKAPATTLASYTCPMCGGDFKQMGACPKCRMALVTASKK